MVTEELFNDLQKAVHKNDIKKIDKIFASIDVNDYVLFDSEYAPIHIAVKENDLLLLDMLLQRGAELERRSDTHLYTPLSLAVKKKNIEMVRNLLDRGANINSVDADGHTPMHHAVELGLYDIATLLCEYNPDLTILDHKGDNPFHMNTSFLDIRMADILLGCGADINGLNSDGQSALMYAVTNPHDTSPDVRQMARFLLDKGANPNILDQMEVSPLAYAIAEDNDFSVHDLLKAGADPNLQLRDRWTPLLLAIARKNHQVVEMMVENGADINLTSVDQNTPLHSAVSSADIFLVRYLLEKGADTHIKNMFGEIPLHIAAELNDLLIIKLLVDAGSNVNAKTNDNESVMFLSSLNNQVDMDDIRNDSRGKFDIANYLLMEGFDLNNENLDNYPDDLKGYLRTILAIDHMSPSLLKQLFKEDSDFWLKMARRYGRKNAYPTLLRYYRDLFPVDIPLGLLDKMATL